jgi:hypothetical protein
VYVYLTGWDGVDGDLLRCFRCARVAGSVHPNEPVDPFRALSCPVGSRPRTLAASWFWRPACHATMPGITAWSITQLNG